MKTSEDRLNDAFVLDTRTSQIENVIKQTKFLLERFSFASINNVSVTPAKNVVVALVIGDASLPYLIQYSIDTNSLDIVENEFPSYAGQH